MNDNEIYNYLETHSFEVDAQDFIINILNTSHQIMHQLYNAKSHMMTIVTPDNTFSFKWRLGIAER